MWMWSEKPIIYHYLLTKILHSKTLKLWGIKIPLCSRKSLLSSWFNHTWKTPMVHLELLSFLREQPAFARPEAGKYLSTTLVPPIQRRMAAKTIRAPLPPGILLYSLLSSKKPAMEGWHWSRSTANGTHLIWAQTDTPPRLITMKTDFYTRCMKFDGVLLN